MQSDLFSLANRVAIVTGSARGLGRALAEGLARQGARVVVCDLDLEGARATADGIRAAGGEAVATGVDVAEAESCDALMRFAVERLGRVDVLVNNAGIDIAEPVGEVTAEVWSKILDVNLKGVLNASQSALRPMRAQGNGGAIINISSIAGLVAIPGLTAYSAAKGGVLLLTRVLVQEPLEWRPPSPGFPLARSDAAGFAPLGGGGGSLGDSLARPGPLQKCAATPSHSVVLPSKCSVSASASPRV